MPQVPQSEDLKGSIVFLGTGTSSGVPIVGCRCVVCTSQNPKNSRYRCAVVAGLPGGNLLIDTPIELRLQLLRENISSIHALAYTHAHADHLFGFDDLRIFAYRNGVQTPIFCREDVEQRIRTTFDYAFPTKPIPIFEGGIPQVSLCRIDRDPFRVLGAEVIPIPLQHGPWQVLGFRIGNVAYCTDTNAIPDSSWPLLEGLDVLILDALRPRPHPTHFSLKEAIAAAKQVRPHRTIFTHISHEMEHEEVNAQLEPGFELAYDGLRIPLTGLPPD